MLEIYGNALEVINNPEYTGLCITTNGYVRKDGACVMGRGIALAIKTLIPLFPYKLGEKLTLYGNHVFRFKTKYFGDKVLYSFPVKHVYNEAADINLIMRSCKELMHALGPDDKVILPRPGCGNGRLEWSFVKSMIRLELDDRVSIIHWKEE
jgi:hypothetical protein